MIFLLVIDLPSVVSGSRIAFFDPHAKYVRKGQNGRMFRFSKAKKDVDQFAPYNVLDCDLTKPSYNGTLFRFPMRLPGHKSKLSQRTHSADSIRKLFESFKADAHLVLLFLKSVISIQLLEWNPGDSKPHVTFRVEITDSTKDQVLHTRKKIKHRIKSGEMSIQETFTAGITCCSNQSKEENQEWTVLHYICKMDPEVKRLSEQLKQLPWVGLAFPLRPKTKQASDLGRIFCFLPLPPGDDEDSNTGFPVHVHGSFSVTDNRRSLKWPSKDRETDESADWNYLLLQHLVSPAYAALIKYLVANHAKEGDVDDRDRDAHEVYTAWPTLGHVKPHWSKKVIPSFLESLSIESVLWTKANGGKWIDSSQSAVCESARLHAESRVLRAMIDLNECVVHLPPNVWECLREVLTDLRLLNPQFVRAALKKSDVYENFNREQKLHLLTYVVEDKDYADLAELKLLPLRNGEFTVFALRSQDVQPIFISSPSCSQDLFPDHTDRFLDISLDTALNESLSSQLCCAAVQLEYLKPSWVCKLIKEILPQSSEKNYGGEIVAWSPEKSRHPNKDWFQKIWRWLINQQDNWLSYLVGCHLIPFDNFSKLAQISLHKNVIFTSHPTSKIRISDNLAHGLGKRGCIVLQNCPDYVYLSRELLNYIWTPDKVLACVANGVPSTSCDWSLDQREELVSLIGKVIGSNPPAEKSREALALTVLPLFRSFKLAIPKSLTDCREFAPSTLDVNLPLQLDLLRYPNLSEKNILRSVPSCEYKDLSFPEVFKETVFPTFTNMNHSDKLFVIKYLLNNEHLLDKEMCQQMKSLTFVSVGEGQLRRPDQVFDSKDRTAISLFSGKLLFPTGDYASDKPLGKDLKRVVGFRSVSSITTEELVSVCKEAAAGSISKGKTLLRLFAKEKWAKNRLVASHEDLSRLQWCPVESKAPDNYPRDMPWKATGKETTCQASEIVFLPKETNISCKMLHLMVGSQAQILKVDAGTEFDKETHSLIGFKVPSPDEVCLHWVEATKGYKRARGSRKLFDRMMKALFSALPLMIEHCWAKNAFQDALRKYFSEGNRFLWVDFGIGFIRSSQIAKSSCFEGSLEPWLFCVSSASCSHLRQLTADLKIKEEFDKSDILDVLLEVKEFYDQNPKDADPEKDLSLVIQILNWLAKGDDFPSDFRSKLFVPINEPSSKRLKLKPCEDLVYRDAEWLSLSSNPSLSEHGEVHHKIAPTTARKLGVRSLSEFIAESVPLYEPFGQREPLTLRIRNIIDEYKDGLGIFKELIQNADDAQAKKICFLIDLRRGKTSSLLSEGMKECQGPALWAYNDAPFQDKDFVNITKLAGRTKQVQLDKIGNFGQGFNSVYHVTEVPSFVSRNYVVIFDPHQTHLGNHIQDSSQPGIKIDFVKSQAVATFADQFQPYDKVFGCDMKMKKSFPGTLFRLPFRTKHQARNSKIKNEPCDHRQIEKAVAEFKRQASEVMIFLNHVESIEVYRLPENSTSPTQRSLQFRVTSKISSSIPAISQFELLKGSAAIAGEKSVDEISKTCSAIKSITVSGIESETHRWLVCSAIGENAALSFSKSSRGQKLKAVPFAGVATKLEKSTDTPQTVKGKVFCFLPLPVATNLPFHVNGVFSVLSNRRGLCLHDYEEEGTSFGAEWNKELVTDAVLEASLTLFQRLTDLLPRKFCLDSYYQLWPSSSKTANIWNDFCRKFYSAIVSRDFMSTSNDPKKWTSFSKALLLSSQVKSLPYAKELTVGAKAPVYVDVPDCCSHVTDSLQTFSKDFLLQRTLNVEKFVEEILVEALPLMSPYRRNKLVFRILSLVLSDQLMSLEHLKNLQFVPCSPSGKSFQPPCRLIEPKNLALKLFSPSDGRFPFKEVESDEMILALKMLGMKKCDALDLNDVIERIENVKHLRFEDREKRVNAILKLLNNLLQSQKVGFSDLLLQKAMATPFLPVMTCPKDYFLSSKWYGNNSSEGLCAVLSGRVFFSEWSLLVGSQASILTFSSSELKRRASFVWNLFALMDPPLTLILRQFYLALNKGVSEKKLSSGVESMLISLYKEINQRLERNEFEDSFVRDEIMLNERNWILIENRLVKSSQVAFDCDIKAAPYLYQVPDYLQLKIRRLLVASGVVDKFDRHKYADLLIRMGKDKKGKRLNDRSLDVCMQLLTRLAKEDTDWRRNLRGEKEVPLVSEKKTLVPATHLTYADVSWATGLSQGKRCLYVHEDYSVSMKVAEDLGVKLIRDRILSAFPGEFPGYRFGQQEPLTRRLKKVIETYPWGRQILQEFVQNAEDARASTLHVIFDKRNHGGDKVFQDKWKALQGPALLIYNDRPFTREDIEGIQQLGLGSKGEHSDKVGQFGIGFNSAYHLTDCPSFLSGNEKLCIMDPHCKFVPGATNDAPGRLFEPAEEILKSFPDVKKCFYSVFREPESVLKKGTLFRFPLRTADLARESEICSDSVSVERVDNLILKFAESASDMLLFLTHLRSIKISAIDESGVSELFSSKTKECGVGAVEKRKRPELVDKVQESKHLSTNDVKFFGVTYLLSIETETETVFSFSENSSSTVTWLVHQSLGGIGNFRNETNIGLLPRVGVAAPVSLELFDNAGMAFCFLPLPVFTSLPVHINGHFALDTARKYLFFETTNESNVGSKQQWNEDIIDFAVVPAYAKFLLAAQEIAKTNDEWLQWYYQLFPNKPTEKTSAGYYWGRLTRQLYVYLEEKNLEILAYSGRPLSFDRPRPRRLDSSSSDEAQINITVQQWDGCFTDSQTLKWLPIGKKSQCGITSSYFWNQTQLQQQAGFLSSCDVYALKSIFLLMGMPIVAVPQRVFENFRAVVVVDASTVRKFLFTFNQEGASCVINLGKVSETVLQTPESVNLVLKFLLQSGESIDGKWTPLLDVKQIDGVPLLLTEDGHLRVFSSKRPVFLSAYSHLLPNSHRVFLHSVLHSTFQELHWQQTSFLKRLLPSCLGDLLLKELDFFASGGYLKWSPDVSSSFPSKEWIAEFWEYIKMEVDETGNLESLARLSVIPVIRQEQHFLIPPNLTYTAFYFSSDDTSAAVYQIFSDLGISRLNRKFIKKHSIDRLAACGYRVALLNQLDRATRALLYHFDDLEFDPPAPDQASKILQHFETQTGGQGLTDFRKRNIKKLPLFKRFSDLTCREIRDLSRAVVLSPKLPKVECWKWISRSPGYVFLQKTTTLKGIYSLLGIATMELPEVYKTCILPAFEFLSNSARVEHLVFIASCCKTNDSEWKNTLSKLESTPCFSQEEHSDQAPLTVNNFFHPGVKLFQLMLMKEFFPPTIEDTNEITCQDWLNFLRRIGLQIRCKPRKLLEFAMRIQDMWTNREETSGTEAEETAEMAQTLVAHMCHSWTSYYRDNLSTSDAETLANTKFLPVQRIRTDLNQLSISFAGRLEPVKSTSFKQGVLYSGRNELLCWASRPLFPSWESLENLIDKSDKLLAITASPSANDVLSNIRNYTNDIQGSTGGELSSEDVQLLVSINSAQFIFLQSLIIGLSPQLLGEENLRNGSNCSEAEKRLVEETLHEQPCIFIPSHKCFAVPYKVVEAAEKEVPPMLFRLPEYLLQNLLFLRRLGVEQSPQAFHYSRILENIFSCNSGAVLDPNTFKLALSAVKNLFLCLKKLYLREGAERYAELALASSLHPLYLPDNRGKLHLSTDLVFLDRLELKPKIARLAYSFLVDLKECDLPPLSEETVDLLPNELRLKRFTDIAEEAVLKESLKESTNMNCCQRAHALKCRLSSPLFVSGIKSIVIHEQKTEDVSYTVNRGLEFLLNDGLTVKCMETVSTCLCIVENNRKKMIEETKSSCEMFLEKADDKATLYISETACRGGDIALFSNIALKIQELLQYEFQTQVALLTILSEEPIFIASALEKFGIHFADQIEDVVESGTTDFGVRAGKDVLSVHRRLINFNFTHDFQVEQWVAYEKEESRFVYALIHSRVYDTEDANVQVYYMIEIGEENPIKVHSLTLYGFQCGERKGTVTTAQGSLSLSFREETVHEKFSRVHSLLDKIWALPKPERMTAIRRLYLFWHPDKSEDPNAEEIFKLLQNDIVKRSNEEDTVASLSGRRRGRRGGSGGGGGGGGWGGSGGVSNSEAIRELEESFRAWDDTVEIESQMLRSTPNYNVGLPTLQHSPDKATGKMFLKQAKADLAAAIQCYQNALSQQKDTDRNFSIVCFLCHEAVEKALKGVLFCRVGISHDRLKRHNLHSFLHAAAFTDRAEDIRRFTQMLDDRDYINSRYPDALGSVPAEYYSEGQAAKALEGATKVVEILCAGSNS